LSPQKERKVEGKDLQVALLTVFSEVSHYPTSLMFQSLFFRNGSSFLRNPRRFEPAGNITLKENGYYLFRVFQVLAEWQFPQEKITEMSIGKICKVF